MTRVVRAGLIGSGIGLSRTPALHMEEGRQHGIDYRYDLIDLDALGVGPDALESLIAKAEAQGFAGLNITHPCKQAAIAHVDELSDDAAVLQSINTITFNNGKRKGHNTDWWGFQQGFRRGLPDVDLSHAVLIGAGGAGVAVAHALARMGTAKVTIFDVDPARVSAVMDRLVLVHPDCVFGAGKDLGAVLAGASGIVQATPIGMASHPGTPFDVDLLSANLWVAEIIYFPLETALLTAAAERGCKVLNGGGMAVFQAVGAFELFTGAAPDAERMIRHFSTL
ncbi:shikimate dehydrogenase [Pararhizobium sp. BT-229]|uniref:shikimate dehydrogenase n=1 Tax=Pararhizobium sp. BT-229 TaxID=2986923 RepID=UPI0021F78E8C|nr:shikimate dehydrogenase [Pararhizobium sp. BT-229]MCV9966947.1 shikimate dehydrogenase [Pararhizobium sp. BT-229]